ncbi:hypothetical protein BDY19DRAFT_988352 [Irpex rosettiformis]|uniref:Uncharacterized protein n=1 Tax=Irpex rosettiformis TaxID=378272 RepID=A0ACB8UK70_9APHY|nr:hypothetical protein BDY19DRAFT_988352 [Irpex rosettiformis]
MPSPFLTLTILTLALTSDARSTPSRMLYKLPNYARDAAPPSERCAYLVGKIISVAFAPGAALTPIGEINTCLCQSGISNFESINTVAIAAVTAIGTAATTDILNSLISTNGQTCTYPENAIPRCVPSNPCSFTCGNGFIPTVSISPVGLQRRIPQPNSCICPAGKIICNGLCVESATGVNACPSSTPIVTLTPERKRELEERKVRGKCDKSGKGWKACGVWGSGSQKNGEEAWECVDTKRDVESCGGCIVPFGHNLATGVDCTAIPGVMDVSCAAGSCKISACQSGYRLSENKDYCVPEDAGFLEGLAQAVTHGLEYIPLK